MLKKIIVLLYCIIYFAQNIFALAGINCKHCGMFISPDDRINSEIFCTWCTVKYGCFENNMILCDTISAIITEKQKKLKTIIDLNMYVSMLGLYDQDNVLRYLYFDSSPVCFLPQDLKRRISDCKIEIIEYLKKTSIDTGIILNSCNEIIPFDRNLINCGKYNFFAQKNDLIYILIKSSKKILIMNKDFMIKQIDKKDIKICTSR